MNRIIGVYCEITNKCNQKCPYCYNENSMNEKIELSEDNVNKIANELRSMGIPYITLSGGEPFLHSNINKILDILEKEEIETSVISNGLCFEHGNMFLLKRYQPHLQITFDGYNDETHDITRGVGNFSCIVKGIKNSRENGFVGSIGLRINITNLNAGLIENILDMISVNFLSDNNNLINSIYVAVVHKNSTYSSENILPNDKYTELASKIDKWNKKQKESDSIVAAYEFLNPDIGCPYNGENGFIECGIRIDSNGAVYPCQMFTDPEFILGNIKKSQLQEIISSEKMANVIDKISGRKNQNMCKTCAYQIMCGCGCPAKSLLNTNSIFSQETCKDRKRIFNDILTRVVE